MIPSTARVAGRHVVGASGRLLAAAGFGFVLFRVLPGDPVLALTRGRPVTGEEIVARRHELGLDRPLPEQFWSYVTDLAHGRFGTSYAYRRPVTELIAERVGPTLLLVGSATVLAILLGAWGGSRAGWRPGGWFDRFSTTTALVLWATPTAWLGLLLLVALGSGAGLFPIGGLRATPPPAGSLAGIVDLAHHLVLPCVTLVAVQYGQYHLMTRAATIGEADRPYVTVARATGLREAVVRRRHVLPNALLPVATQAALGLGFVVSGAVTVEAVYSWPGLGHLAYQAVQTPDLPVLHGTFVVFSTAVVAVTALVEVLREWFDPRAGP